MKPLYTASQIRKWDAYTIKNEPIASVDLMERAAIAFVKTFVKHYPLGNRKVKILCGAGNNGGDGLAVARLLHKKGYSVETYYVESEKYSPDFLKNLARLKKINAPKIVYAAKELAKWNKDSVIIDALLGTGLNNAPKGIYAEIIGHINSIKCEVVSIDIPSGMPCNGIPVWKVIVKAKKTISFQTLKPSFLLAENEIYTGEVIICDIGLSEDFLKVESSSAFLLDDAVGNKIKPRKKFSHKGTYGSILICGGSHGKIGAVILSVKAALRSGSGLVTAHIPHCGYTAMQAAEPACMVITSGENFISSFPPSVGFSAVGVGPGMGTRKITQVAFLKFIQTTKCALVIDADGLNILAAKSLWKNLPPNTILTPHQKKVQGADYHFLFLEKKKVGKENSRPSECFHRAQKKCLKQYQSSGLTAQTTSAFGLFSTHFSFTPTPTRSLGRACAHGKQTIC
jgi:ADP-dependent NAD(P)H-hydrate dehydratase / NAD(P)H-hydrate epimerase